MFVPPFDVVSYYESSKEEKYKVFFLSEGQKSEKYFYKHLFQNESYGFEKPDDAIFKEIKKLDSDAGISNGLTLVKKALAWCNNEENRFDKEKDKVVVTFDLDCLSSRDINLLLKIQEPYIIYAFSNPKFELVQLLSITDDLSSLEKEYNGRPKPNNVLENMFSSLTHCNSKTSKSGKIVAENYLELMKHRKYDENDIKIAKTKFCTNVLNILDNLSKK